MRILSAALIAVLFISSCNTGSSDSPTGVLKKFFFSMKEGNIDDLKKFVTKSDASILEAGEKMAGAFNPDAAKKMKEKMAAEFREKAQNVSYEIKDEIINGDKATVNVSVTENGAVTTHPFQLVKEDGSWKISMMSMGLNGMNGADREKMEEGMDKFKNMNADSVREMLKQMSNGMDEFKKMNRDSLKDVMDKGLKSLDSLNEALKKIH